MAWGEICPGSCLVSEGKAARSYSYENRVILYSSLLRWSRFARRSSTTGESEEGDWMTALPLRPPPLSSRRRQESLVPRIAYWSLLPQVVQLPVTRAYSSDLEDSRIAYWSLLPQALQLPTARAYNSDLEDCIWSGTAIQCAVLHWWSLARAILLETRRIFHAWRRLVVKGCTRMKAGETPAMAASQLSWLLTVLVFWHIHVMHLPQRASSRSRDRHMVASLTFRHWAYWNLERTLAYALCNHLVALMREAFRCWCIVHSSLEKRRTFVNLKGFNKIASRRAPLLAFEARCRHKYISACERILNTWKGFAAGTRRVRITTQQMIPQKKVEAAYTMGGNQGNLTWLVLAARLLTRYRKGMLATVIARRDMRCQRWAIWAARMWRRDRKMQAPTGHRMQLKGGAFSDWRWRAALLAISERRRRHQALNHWRTSTRLSANRERMLRTHRTRPNQACTVEGLRSLRSGPAELPDDFHGAVYFSEIPVDLIENLQKRGQPVRSDECVLIPAS